MPTYSRLATCTKRSNGLLLTEKLCFIFLLSMILVFFCLVLAPTYKENKGTVESVKKESLEALIH